jgi:rhodanese-related sulfurtransferase
MNGAMIMSRIAAPLCFSILLLSMLPASEAYPQQSEALQPVMSARESHAKAAAGELVLIDIRSPEEWRETSVPASAHAITMHQDHKTFMMQLGTATGGMREKHVALICATGGRSAPSKSGSAGQALPTSQTLPKVCSVVGTGRVGSNRVCHCAGGPQDSKLLSRSDQSRFRTADGPESSFATIEMMSRARVLSAAQRQSGGVT